MAKKVRRLADGTLVAVRRKKKVATKPTSRPAATGETQNVESVVSATTRRKKKVKKKSHPVTTSTGAAPATGRSAAKAKTNTDLKRAGSRIQAVARGFRLRFTDIGKTKKLEDEHLSRMLENVDTDQDSLRVTKTLYGRNELLRRKASQKGHLLALFKGQTIDFPEKSVRIFPVVGETAEAQEQEVNRFIEQIRREIETYRSIGAELADNWSTVLEESRERLGDLYNPANYPTAEQVRELINATFEPYNFELPDYLKKVNPRAYREAMEELNRKFETAARRHEEALIEGLSSSLDAMKASLEGYHSGEKKTFRRSNLTKVLDVVSRFRTASQQFGLMDSEELNEQINLLESIVSGKKAVTSDKLKTDANLRTSTIQQVGDILDSISKFATPEETVRRNILV